VRKFKVAFSKVIRLLKKAQSIEMRGPTMLYGETSGSSQNERENRGTATFSASRPDFCPFTAEKSGVNM
jgi:hypothetical protein